MNAWKQPGAESLAVIITLSHFTSFLIQYAFCHTTYAWHTWLTKYLKDIDIVIIEMNEFKGKQEQLILLFNFII